MRRVRRGAGRKGGLPRADRRYGPQGGRQGLLRQPRQVHPAGCDRKKPLSEGANIGAAHTDAPRLDFKPNPLYEDAELAYIKTHHYGGIRKYQWVTVPLELHGKIVRADGSEIYVKIGADPEDPQFVINDLLPHLGREQGKSR